MSGRSNISGQTRENYSLKCQPESSRRKTARPSYIRSRDLSALLKLPTEIIQYITYLLPNDADIASFALSSTHLAKKILPAHSSIWRQRFNDLYGIPQEHTSAELKNEYQIRSIVLSQDISFKFGQNEEQTLWLEVLRDMLLEAFIDSPKDSLIAAKTLNQIRKTLIPLEFLSRPLSGCDNALSDPPSDLFCSVQLCLTHLALDPAMSACCLRSDYNIGAVYSYQSDIAEPLVNLQRPDLKKILDIRNFWLRHLLNPNEATFHNSYAKLSRCQQPGLSRIPVDGSSSLSSHWLGFYSCIHPYPDTLSMLERRQTCADLEIHLPQIDPMFLEIQMDPDSSNWPMLFETAIPLMGPQEHRVYFRGIQQQHGSDDTYLVRGFVESILEPHGGFPGWRRFCFAIYDPDREQLPLLSEEDETNGKQDQGMWFPEEAWPPYDLEMEFNWIHGYEGLVIPSGTLMLGRWVDMVDTNARGPFIFWAI